MTDAEKFAGALDDALDARPNDDPRPTDKEAYDDRSRSRSHSRSRTGPLQRSPSHASLASLASLASMASVANRVSRSLSHVPESAAGRQLDANSTSKEEDSPPDPFLVDWDGGDADPDCPRSMPVGRKWLLVTVTSVGAVCVTCASSIYTSTYTRMNAEFGTSRIVATLGLSLFVLGIALGPAWSPLSEMYGRRAIYLGSFVLFLIWLVPGAVAQNIQTMLVARFFQGLSGSAFLSVAGGTVSDLFSPAAMQAPMAVFTAAPFIGPSIGPLIGGFINYNTANWRWTHYTLLLWSGCTLLALYLLVPETYHPVLLARRAAARRRATGDVRWQSALEKRAAAADSPGVARAVGHALLRPFQLLAYEPMCLALDLYAAVLLGVLYLFFGAFPLVFGNHHGFKLWQTGLAFLGLLVGCALGAASFPVWVRIRQRLMRQRQVAAAAAMRAASSDGTSSDETVSPESAASLPPLVSEPEDRLPSVMLGAILVPIGLFWFGWTSMASVPWILPIIGSGIFATGTILAFSGIFTFLVDAYPLYAASALASNAFVRCTSAAAFPLFGVQMYNKLGYAWASSLLAFLALAMLPFPFLFFRYGKKLRGMSRFATHT